MDFVKVRRKTRKGEFWKMMVGIVWSLGGVVGIIIISAKIARYISN